MKIKNLKYKMFATVALFLIAGAMYLFEVPCIILALTNFPCPGCGMTRALFSALTLDIHTAFSHHAMFWSVPVLYLAMLFDGRLFPKKSANIFLYSAIAVGFLINWLVRLF